MSSTAQNLPHDILRELFEHLAAVDPPDFKDEMDMFSLGWILATHVCGRWREVGLSVATLWADVVCTFPSVPIAEELVTRARGCLLDIAVGHFPPDLKPGFPAPHLPISWGLQYLQRAHTFRCDVERWSTFSDDHPTARAALISTLPLLKHLRLDCKITQIDDPLPVIQLDCPALLTAEFRDILPHSSSTANTLRRLALDLGRVRLDDISPILGALREMLSLEDLKLGLGSYDTLPLSTHAVVHLERLRTLRAVCASEQQASDLFDYMSAPNITHTSIHISAKLRDGRIFARAVAQKQQSLLLTGTISITESRLQLEGTGPEHAVLELGWSTRAMLRRDNVTMTYASVLSALSRHIDLSRFTACALQCPKGSGQDESVDAVLAVLRKAFVSIKTLTIHGAPTPTALKTLLGRPSGEPSALPFPALDTLCVGGAYRSSHIWQMLGSREPAVHQESTVPSYWTTFLDVLLSRFRGGHPVRCLCLDGVWCEHEVWGDEGDKRSCLKLGLVSEITDKREYIVKCRSCTRE
ncbi:unnamed protein product [Peniophora sp. CBMAI 1063]|nr:unnamed protein product [Peniophora sp. CBMAI 1063]